MSGKPRVHSPDSDTGNLIRDSALGLVPETLQHYLDLTAAIWDKGPLSPAEIELARLRNASYVGCVMCQAVRYDIAVEDPEGEGTAMFVGRMSDFSATAVVDDLFAVIFGAFTANL